MTAFTIRKFPDSILRKKAAKVTSVGDTERAVLARMAQTMYLSRGVGLAAVQVGIDRQFAVVDTGSGLLKLINPTIVKKEGREALEEGCLSVPDLHVNVKRAKTITVNFLDEDGGAVQLKASGLLGRAIQHEIDHLSGTLIIDYLNPVKRLLLRPKRLGPSLSFRVKH